MNTKVEISGINRTDGRTGDNLLRVGGQDQVGQDISNVLSNTNPTTKLLFGLRGELGVVVKVVHGLPPMVMKQA